MPASQSLKDAKTAKKRKHDDDGSDNDSGSDKGHSKAAARGKRQAASMKVSFELAAYCAADLTPRLPFVAAQDFTDHHWVLLNKAATEVLLSHQTELFALCPELVRHNDGGQCFASQR